MGQGYGLRDKLRRSGGRAFVLSTGDSLPAGDSVSMANRHHNRAWGIIWVRLQQSRWYQCFRTDRRLLQYGGMQVNQARRLKELELENGRLKRLLALSFGHVAGSFSIDEEIDLDLDVGPRSGPRVPEGPQPARPYGTAKRDHPIHGGLPPL